MDVVNDPTASSSLRYYTKMDYPNTEIYPSRENVLVARVKIGDGHGGMNINLQI